MIEFPPLHTAPGNADFIDGKTWVERAASLIAEAVRLGGQAIIDPGPLAMINGSTG